MEEEIQYHKEAPYHTTSVKDQGYEDPKQDLSTDFSEGSTEAQNHIEVISYAKIVKEIVDAIDELKDSGYSESLSLKMLVKHQWNKIIVKDRISYELNTLTIEDKSAFECLNCSLQDQIGNAYSLGCNHWFCKPCFLAFLDSAIQENHFLKPCPVEGCSEVISLEHYEKYLKSGLKDYEMMVVKNFVRCHDNLTLLQCPQIGCLMALKPSNLGNSEPITISCECGYSFCSKCFNAPHKRLTCQKYSEWISMLPEICENEDWIEKNTKKCPMCRERCLREGEEKFVMCANCLTEFCWLCSDFSNTHGFMCGETPLVLDNGQCSSPKQFKQLLEANEQCFRKKDYVFNGLNHQRGQHIIEAIDTITEIRGELAMTYAIEYFCNVNQAGKENLDEFRNKLCKALDDFDKYLSQLLYAILDGNADETMKNWREELIVDTNCLKCQRNSFFESFEKLQYDFQME